MGRKACGTLVALVIAHFWLSASVPSVSSTSFSPPHTDSALDNDLDGYYDYLVVNVGLGITKAGRYHLYGTLYSEPFRRYISKAERSVMLAAGTQTVPLYFKGSEISRSRVDGPYRVYLYISDENRTTWASDQHTTSAYAYASFQGLTIPREVSLDSLLEFKSTGRCRIKVDYSGPNPLLYAPAIPMGMGFAAGSVSPTSPAKSIGWDIKVEISSPGEGMLTVTAGGWVVLPLTEEQKLMVRMAVMAHKFSPRTFNQMALHYIRRGLWYIPSDVEITGVDVSQLDWDDQTSKLTFGATLFARGTKLRELQGELPINIYTRGEGSYPPLLTEETVRDMRLDYLMRCVGKRSVAEVSFRLAEDSRIGIDVEFDIPVDGKVVTKTENLITVDLGKLQYWPTYAEVPEVQAHENIRFVMRVPPGAEVSNLPPGYTQMNSAYRWTGTSAVNAILSLISGEAGTRVSYYVGPAAAAIRDIRGSVGQTIEVGKAHVKSVKVLNERAFVMHFEEDQPLRNLKVNLVEPADLEVKMQRISEKPEGVSELPAEMGMVCYYLELKTTAPGRVGSANLEFVVPKLWMRVNDIDPGTVRLLRYEGGKWAELETKEVGEDEVNVYFSAKTSGFSLFAVVARSRVPPMPLSFKAIIIVALVLAAILVAVVWRYRVLRPRDVKPDTSSRRVSHRRIK